MQNTTVTDIEILAALPPCVDLVLLKDRFANYKAISKKLSELGKKQYLFRIKRGNYLNLKSSQLLATSVHRIALEQIANTLYAPSYVSAEWALHYHGLLLERVETITSVTTRSAATYHTPLGNFSYEHISRHRYPHGFILHSTAETSFLVATPVKALLDLLSLRYRTLRWSSDHLLLEFLEENLRLDSEKLVSLTAKASIKVLTPYYHRNSAQAQLLRWLLAQKKGETENG